MGRYLRCIAILAVFAMAILAPVKSRAADPHNEPVVESLGIEVRLEESPKVVFTETIVVSYCGQGPFRGLRRAIPKRWLAGDRNTIDVHQPIIKYVLRDGEPDAFSTSDSGFSLVVAFDNNKRPVGPSRYRYDLQYEIESLVGNDPATGKEFLRLMSPGDWSVPIESFAVLFKFRSQDIARQSNIATEYFSFLGKEDSKTVKLNSRRNGAELIYELGKVQPRSSYAFWLQSPKIN